MKTTARHHPPFSQRNSTPIRKQRGVVLFIALIVLVAMSLAGVSMMRAVDTGTRVAGNLISRESSTISADPHFETVLKQIVAMVNNGSSKNPGAAVGYSYVALGGSPETRDWANAQCMAADADTGNQVCLLFDRMCSGADTTTCEVTMGNPLRFPGQVGLGNFRPPYVHFRTLARVTDPKGMVSYIEFKND